MDANQFLGKAKTAGYRPGLISGGRSGLAWAVTGNWKYTTADGDIMRQDGLVRFCLRTLYGPLATVTATVEADDAEAGKEAEETFNKVWQQELPKLFISVPYGWLPAEVMYLWDDTTGRVLFDCLAEVHPLDAVPLQKGRRLAGIALRGAAAPPPAKSRKSGEVPPHWLLPPRSLWVAHEAEFGSLYGTGRLQAMWLPWLERVGRHGYLDIRRTWFLKNAYRGGEIRYPDGEIQVAPGQWMSNRDFAIMMVEQEETGSVAALPNTRDADTKEYEWVRSPAAPNGDIPGVLEYGDRLFDELLLAAGIPPEIVKAGGTGSGWSGRNVPHLGFLKSEDGLADGIAQAVWSQIVIPQVAANHGERAARGCRLKVRSLVPPEAEGDPSGGKAGSGGVPGFPAGLMAPPPIRMAQDDANPWQPYRGPRGGEGWLNARTGEVVYRDTRPEADETDAAEPDKTGRKGTGPDAAGGEAPKTPAELLDAADKKADSLIARGKAALAELMKMLDESTADRPVLNWVNAAVKWAGEKTRALYGLLESRYGQKTAMGVFASGTVVAWGVTGASYALTGVPLAFPGMGTICMLPGLAAAELYKRLRGAAQMALDGAEPSMDDIRRLAEWAAEELRAGMQDFAREKPFPPSRWDAPPAQMSQDEPRSMAEEALASGLGPALLVAEEIRRKVRSLAKKGYPPGS